MLVAPMQNDVIGLIYRQPVTQALLAEMILVAGRSDIPSLFLHSPADAEHFILEQAKPLPLGNLTDLVGRRERQCRLILAPEIWLSGEVVCCFCVLRMSLRKDFGASGMAHSS